ncbi:MAG: GHKL domain-containing protein [Roseburia sp.]|nr:GHKL domain-containing protein [Roseburia sp.]MCM1278849.1 GHKL domain-containing protein [Robinsoniella sp.]
MTEQAIGLISLFLNVFAMLNIWFILNLLFGCDMKLTLRNLAIASGVFVFIEYIDMHIFEKQQELGAILMFAYNVLVTLILTKKKRMKTLLLTIPALLVYAEFGIFLDLVERIIGIDQYYIGMGKFSLTDFIADPLLFAFLVWLNRTKVAKVKSVQLTIGEGVIVSLFCFFSPALIKGLEWFEGMIYARIYKIVWICFMIILNIAVVYAIAHRKMATYYRQLSENYKKEFETEYSFFKNYKKQQEDTIKFRHDWKNHMLLLQEMLEKEQYGKAESYFKELTAATPKTVQKIATGNELLDMILSMKMDILEENEITLHCKGALSEFNFMKYADSCILLSNLIDNAIEANAKVINNSHSILLAAKKTEQLFYLEISNPIEGNLQQENDRILTTKAEKGNHGIGLQNVHDVLEKYGGEYHITTQNQEYTIQMIFPV